MADKVPVIKLSNGNTVPALGLGTWKSKPEDVTEAVKFAIDIGYRHIDSAHVYLNEKEIGQALKEKLRSGFIKREDIFITSALWNSFHSPELVEGALRTTLENLGVEYLDLYLIHWPQGYKEDGELFEKDVNGKIQYSDVDYVDTWKGMEKMVELGLTKSIGLSNFNKSQLDRVLAVAKIKPVINQIECHPYLNQQKLFDYCASKDIAITAYSPLGSPDRPWIKPGDPVLMDDPRLKIIADRYKKNVPQILIRYALDRGMIVIPKSSNKMHIAQNFDVLDFKLSGDDLKQMADFECGKRYCSIGDTDHPHYPFHDEY